jgi:phosphoribosyl 1,2-cyclic phosphodiesterase
MTLRLRFWGTRGSIPSPGPATVRYGGNTPCIEVRTEEDRLVILDGGTGLRGLGNWLRDRQPETLDADLFVTHTHWDHIQGIPFFAPLYAERARLRVWCGRGADQESLDHVLTGQMAAAVFPIALRQAGSTVEFAANAPASSATKMR